MIKFMHELNLDHNFMKYLEIIRPDDWHVHFRDLENLENTVPATAKTFSRALIMPNIIPPLIQLDDLINYRSRIIQSIPKDLSFTPYMTLYLNEKTSPQTLIDAKKTTFVLGAKLYPANATTHSEAGVHDLQALYPLFSIMQEQDLVLQIHGEAIEADIFDREAAFISGSLIPITQNFPKLRIVLEHISTKAAVDFVSAASGYVAATITPHHLFYNRNDMLNQGIKPHLYCLPILKRQSDQFALQQAAMSGNTKFFAGTDSAPHAVSQKESACGCAGIFSAPYAVALYAQLFDSFGKLDQLEAFLSRFGAVFYNLPLNQETLILQSKQQVIPSVLPLGKHQVVPIAAGQSISWSIHES
jgi:dihydroorotase